MLGLNSALKNNKFPFILFIFLVSAITGFMFINKKPQVQLDVKSTEEGRPNILGAANPSPVISVPINQPKPSTQIPKKTPIKIGLVVEDYSNRSGLISNREKELGRNISQISIFKQFGFSSNKYLVAEDLAHIKSRGITLMISWEPWNPTEGLNQSVDYLKEIPEGKHDEYIKSFATQIKDFGAPVNMRFGHEMNGDWYPWGTRPNEYIQAYRRIKELFKNEGVTNTTWVWSVNTSPSQTIGDYYPGSEYVDIIGIDGFNFGTSQPGHTWVSFGQIFNQSYNIVLSYNKPVIISETASSEIGGNKSEWINDMFASIRRDYPQITEIVWLDLNKETDWRIDSSASSKQAFLQSL